MRQWIYYRIVQPVSRLRDGCKLTWGWKSSVVIGAYAKGSSHPYLALLNHHHIKVSMSLAGSPYDNAAMENFYATLKTECVDRRYQTRSEVGQAIFEFIKVWYNRARRHSSLGYASPEQFEQSPCVVSQVFTKLG